MIDPFLKNKAENLAKQLGNAIPIDKLNDKYRSTTDKDRAQFDEIQKRSIAYFKSNDLKGLQKYLKHIRTKL